jgi:hypothetical protein
MKTKALIAILFLIGLTIQAQTKIFTGFVVSIYCYEDDCFLQLQKQFDSPEMLSFILDYNRSTKTLTINPEFKDLCQPAPIAANYIELNPKYAGKKIKVTCTAKGTDYVVNKVEYDTPGQTKAAPTVQADNFKTAICKVYENDKLVAIAEGQILYSIDNANQKHGKTATQNTNEFCEGTRCARVIINKDAFVVVYVLPNVTDGRIIGKVEGDKIYYCRKAEGFKPIGNYVVFKGDKQKAALILSAYDWFR